MGDPPVVEYRTSLLGTEPRHLEGFFAGWRRPIRPQHHFQILTNSSFVVLAWDVTSRRVVGFVTALSDGANSAFIPLLEVLPAYQGRGIGSELVRRMLDLLRDIPCVDLTCDLDLQPFYERFGLLPSHGMIIRR